MPLDAVCLQAIVSEVRPQTAGLRIDKVQQPARDQVILTLRGNRRLLLHAGSSAPRLHLTALTRDNPVEPPMFCMLLRKHLLGARIAGLSQPLAERLVEFELDTADEFGQAGKRYLILECMGRRSNLLLLDGQRRIIDCLHRVYPDLTKEYGRCLAPGWFYQPPEPPDKIPLLSAEENTFFAALNTANPEWQTDQFLLDNFYGFSPLLARELSYTAAGDSGTRLFQLDTMGRERLWEAVQALQERIRTNQFQPVCLRRNGQAWDYSCVPIRQYGGAVDTVVFPDFSSLLDEFYAVQEQRERAHQRSAGLVKTVTAARNRLQRKIALQEKDYAAAQDREQWRLYGDLITANLYRMESGHSRFVTENFYDGNGGSVEIPLDPLLSPQKNAAKYYKKYTKAKAAERHLSEQLELGRRELDYLESVLAELADSETEQDFIEIRRELHEAGYARQKTIDKRAAKRVSRPREFRTSTGYRVLVGRNNRQNDQLTLKTAARTDLWFHTQKIHGSHVILCTDGHVPDTDTIREAAMIAAYYSQARSSGNVPVDYTLARHVKKPAGARPGMVVYPTYQTVYVTPDETLVKQLSVNTRT